MTITPDIYPSKVGVQQLRETLRLGLAVVTELWSFTVGDWVTSVHAADIDGDGDHEVLLGSRDGSINVLTRRGLLKWKKQTDQSSEWIGSVYGINNVEAGDRTRVIVGSRNNKVTALDETGQIIWQYKTGQVVRRVRVHDINGDGKAEVIIGSEDCCVHVLSCATGQLLWKYETNGWIRSVFSIDMDGDGEIETLAASGDKYLYLLDSHGQLKQKINARGKVHTLYPVDINHDGEVEILVASDAKDLSLITMAGKRLWTFHPENRIHSINVIDLDNDGRFEVIAASEDEHIYFLDDQGTLLWKHFLGHRIFSISSVDINRDGIWEILVGSEDNTVRLLRIELSAGLLNKVRHQHAELGHPHTSTLNLSATESALLGDLTDEGSHHESGLSLTQVEHLLQDQEYLAALRALLRLEQQRVQVLWTREIGHIRTAALNTEAGPVNMEIVIGTDEGDIKNLDMQGNVLWSYSFHERIRALQVADVDQDGVVEIIVGSTDRHVYALNENGQAIKWQTQFGDWIESICTNGTNSSDATEMIFCSADNKIHIYAGDFVPLIEPITTPQSIQIVRTGDIDGDGVNEIIAGAIDNNVYAYTRTGQLLWIYQTLDRVKAISMKDIDHDGQIEILVGSEDRNVHVLDHHGQLKWRYYTPHRVLDVDALDVDQNGQIEVLAGVGHGNLYVLNGVGDVLWQFEANDRIRVIRAADMNRDGIIEILLGSEDRLYLLQMLDQQPIQAGIETCWQALQTKRTTAEVVQDLLHQPDAILRAFAIRKMVSLPNTFPQETLSVDALLNDEAYEVKMAFAAVAADLYRLYPHKIRAFLEMLSTDLDRDIREAFLASLPALCEKKPALGFEYLDRFTRNVNPWIRRTVVRKLDQLVLAFPERVFDILMKMIQDETDWIRQEAARVLAHYLDVHSQDLLRGARLLVTKELEPSFIEVVLNCATTPQAQNVFRAFVELLSSPSEVTILGKLKNMVAVLDTTRTLGCGECMYKIHQEFFRLHRMRTIDEIAQYKCVLECHCLPDTDDATDEMYFDDTLSVLHQLNTMTATLRTYLRREGLGDRISSLLEATTLLDKLLTDMASVYFTWCRRRENFPDYYTLKLLLTRWRGIIVAELGRLRGKAELRPELQTRIVPQEEVVSVVLSIHNTGRSPADRVAVTLNSDSTFTIIAQRTLTFETIPTHEPVQVEFTIRPYQQSLRLTFDIRYDDAEAKEKLVQFGDRVDLVGKIRSFTRIHNPYYTGNPIQDQSMFYGREQELALLREDFVHSSANTVVVLYGQRRSGKSSLLYKLIQMPILDPHIPIRIDMQHETLNFSTNRFLRTIAHYIYRELGKRGCSIRPPDPATFDYDATFALDLFLDEVEVVLGTRKLVILIDEFEILEEKVLKGELDRDIFVYLRSLMQHRRGIHFLLAGTHTIKDLITEYWSVFFNIAIHRRLSKLTPDAARELITRPIEGVLEYDTFAIEKIHYLTGDQPYLIQLICHSLVQHCNTQQKNYVTINDVNMVLDDVMETGNMYFNWIWEQASKEERTVLSMVAQEGGDEGHYVSLTDIERLFLDYGLPYKREHILSALHNLRDGDVIMEVPRENRFKIPVGLTRVWLRAMMPLQRVILEENLLNSSTGTF